MGNDVLYLSLSNEIDTFSLFRWNLIFFLYFLFVFFLSCLSSLFGCGKEKRSNLMSIFYGCVCCCCCCCCCYFWSLEGEKNGELIVGGFYFFYVGFVGWSVGLTSHLRIFYCQFQEATAAPHGGWTCLDFLVHLHRVIYQDILVLSAV